MKKKLEHPAWFYTATEARLFEAGETVPEGWSDTPQRDPLDHDGDGRKGGSRKAKVH